MRTAKAIAVSRPSTDAFGSWEEDLAQNFGVSEQFWSDFVENCWQQKPMLIKSPFKCPLITESDFFRIMRDACESYRSFTNRALGCWVGFGLRNCDISDFLVCRDDESLDSYKARLAKVLGKEAITLSVYNCQSYDFRLWMRVRHFLRPLYARVGMPISKVDLDTFFGRYSRTPTGIHKDNVANFSYVVSGRKRMLLWPDPAFDGLFPRNVQILDTARYEQFKATAIEIEGEAGDIIFWPPTYWHMAVSEGAWSSTLNIALYVRSDFLQSMHYITNRQLNSAISRFIPPPLVQIRERGGTVATVPAEIMQQGEIFRTLGQDARVKECIEDRWFRKLSASGFDSVPPSVPSVDLNDGDTVRGDTSFSIFLVPRGDGKAKVFANGDAFEVSSDEYISSVVSRLNSGRDYTVGELAADNRRTVLPLLLFLCARRALHLVKESSVDSNAENSRAL